MKKARCELCVWKGRGNSKDEGPEMGHQGAQQGKHTEGGERGKEEERMGAK